MNKKVFYLVVSVIAICAFIAWVWWSQDVGNTIPPLPASTHEMPHSRAERVIESVNKSNGVDAALDRSYLWRPADTNLIRELHQVFQDIVVAYSNRQAKIIHDKFSQVSENLMKLPFKERESIGRVASKAFFGEFFCKEDFGSKDRELPEFHETSEFCQYFDTIFEMAHMLGQLALANHYDSNMQVYEGNPLCHLEMYRKKFATEHRSEFVECVNRLETKLKERIDSKDSFAYLGIRRFYENNLKLVEDGEVTREMMLENARLRCLFLIVDVAGYEPKWLDEFK